MLTIHIHYVHDMTFNETYADTRPHDHIVYCVALVL